MTERRKTIFGYIMSIGVCVLCVLILIAALIGVVALILFLLKLARGI